MIRVYRELTRFALLRDLHALVVHADVRRARREVGVRDDAEANRAFTLPVDRRGKSHPCGIAPRRPRTLTTGCDTESRGSASWRKRRAVGAHLHSALGRRRPRHGVGL